MWFLVTPLLSIFFSVLCTTFSGFQNPSLIREVFPSPELISHVTCQKTCIEILELSETNQTTPNDLSTTQASSKKSQPVLLLIPGFFQNYKIFDLDPASKISYARLLRDHLGFKIYFFHPRGMGKSDFPNKLSLDEISATDIPEALEFLFNKEGKKIFVSAHSQGAMTLQAALSGLTLEESQTFDSQKPPNRQYSERKQVFSFDFKIAHKRQAWVSGVALLAGNTAMNHFGVRLAKSALWFKPIVEKLNWVPAKLLTHILSPTTTQIKVWKWGPFVFPYQNFLSGSRSFAWLNSFWSFMYEPSNVSRSAWDKLYSETLQNSTADILLQFSHAVTHKGLQTLNGLSYSEFLHHLQIPVFQLTFEKDPMAIPLDTLQNNFNRIGGKNFSKKRFHTFPKQGHEDFFMNPDFAKEHLPFYKWLLKQTKL